MIELQQQQDPEMEKEEEDRMQQLRSKAAELLLREEWDESIQAYSQFISICQHQIKSTQQNPNPDHNNLSKLQKSLCLALSNRAEARFRLREFQQSLTDCDEALKIESTHFKTLLCKGKILFNLNRYISALDCFNSALLDPQASLNPESINGYLEKCKKLQILSRTGAFDLSDWVVNGFLGNPPELAEFTGPVEIKKSEISGRGLFATKNIDTGTIMFVTKAIATERGILPQSKDEDENAQLVMWKNLIDKVFESASKCHKTHHLISKLSNGEDEDSLEVPGISQFRPELEEISHNPNGVLDRQRLLNILDVNSLVEDADSAKVLGKNSDYYGVGLWLLASFINHSCNPNVRRLHIGDYAIVHACRNIKAGEELTLAYFDVFSPLSNRKEMTTTWGFDCTCRRCKFEEGICKKQDLKEIEMGLDAGGMVYKLEEGMKKWVVRGKEKGYLRASFWGSYSEVFESEKLMRKWGKRIPGLEAVVDSVVEAVGSHEKVLKVLKRSGGSGGGGMVEMERAMKLGRGIYGKVVKKQAMKVLIELCIR